MYKYSELRITTSDICPLFQLEMDAWLVLYRVTETATLDAVLFAMLKVY